MKKCKFERFCAKWKTGAESIRTDFERVLKVASIEPVDHAYIFYVYEDFLCFCVNVKTLGSDFFYTFPRKMREGFFRYADNFYVLQVSGKPWIG